MNHLLAIALCFVLVSTLASAAEKKVTKTPAKVEQASSGQSPQVQAEYMGTLGSQLRTCRALYVSDRETLKTLLTAYYAEAQGDSHRDGNKGRLTELQVVAVRERAVKSAESTSKFGACRSEAMDAFSATGKQFVLGFPDSALQSKAKELLAQWMTAMEAARSDNFDSELSKFNSVANLIKVEMTLK